MVLMFGDASTDLGTNLEPSAACAALARSFASCFRSTMASLRDNSAGSNGIPGGRCVGLGGAIEGPEGMGNEVESVFGLWPQYLAGGGASPPAGTKGYDML